MRIGDRPAFPTTDGDELRVENGMTYRQWLVGMAMQGMLANPNNIDLNDNGIAKEAIACADATLTKLEPLP